jgi:hypothetical protein
VLRSRALGFAQNSVEKNSKEQLKEQKKSNEHLAKIADDKPMIFSIA